MRCRELGLRGVLVLRRKHLRKPSGLVLVLRVADVRGRAAGRQGWTGLDLTPSLPPSSPFLFLYCPFSSSSVRMCACISVCLSVYLLAFKVFVIKCYIRHSFSFTHIQTLIVNVFLFVDTLTTSSRYLFPPLVLESNLNHLIHYPHSLSLHLLASLPSCIKVFVSLSSYKLPSSCFNSMTLPSLPLSQVPHHLLYFLHNLPHVSLFTHLHYHPHPCPFLSLTSTPPARVPFPPWRVRASLPVYLLPKR